MKKEESNKDRGPRRHRLTPDPRQPSIEPSAGPSHSYENEDDELLRGKSDVHIAHDHADTSEGAVHTFQDENGCWMTYTFSQDGSGVARGLDPNLSIQSSLIRSRV